jgi:hypothetical protein
MNVKRIIVLSLCAICLNGWLSPTSQALPNHTYRKFFSRLDRLHKPRKDPIYKMMTQFMNRHHPDLMEFQDKLMSYKSGLLKGAKQSRKNKRAVDKWFKHVRSYITYNFDDSMREETLPSLPHRALFTKVPEFFEADEK